MTEEPLVHMPTYLGYLVARFEAAGGRVEAGTVGSLPTAMNAVMDALRPKGVAHLDMPASAQRVWQALQNARPPASRA